MKERIVILVGAGGSHGYVPVTDALTEALLGGLRSDSCSEAKTIVALVGLLRQRGLEVSGNFEFLIEALDILADIEERQRDPHRWEMSAGRSVLSTLVDINADVEALERDKFWSAIRAHCSARVEDVLRKSQLAGREESHGCVAFVRAHGEDAQVYSLNYDHLLEKGLQKFDVVTHLHGCIADSEGTRALHKCDDVFVTSPSNAEDRGWITGSNKTVSVTLSERYRWRFDDFRRSVSTAERIVTIGYGFGDPHINAVLAERPNKCQVHIIDKCSTAQAVSDKIDMIFGADGMWPKPIAIQPGIGKTPTGWKIDNQTKFCETVIATVDRWHLVGDNKWIFFDGIENVAAARFPPST